MGVSPRGGHSLETSTLEQGAGQDQRPALRLAGLRPEGDHPGQN